VAVIAGVLTMGALALSLALLTSAPAHRRTVAATPGAATAASSVPRRATRSSGRRPLSPPTALRPGPGPAVSGGTAWQPYGRLVDGVAAIYELHGATGTPVSATPFAIAWMDTRLLRATLYSGSEIPGGGPYRHSAPISPGAARVLVAAFNAGFLMDNSNGGYYTDGRVVAPLRAGAASVVIYRNGGVTVANWGRDARMTAAVASVRQNLDLLVDHGRPVPGLDPNDTSVWGYTLGNQVYVWRSGLGVTADGALVYVAGARLNITELADLLVRAGAVRAMELDINTDAVSFATYRPPSPTALASPSNGTDLVAGMVGTPARYFEPWWARDFFTMSAR